MLEKLQKLNSTKLRRFYKGFALATFFVCASFVFAYVSPGSPNGYANDFTGTLTPEQLSTLNSQLATYQTTSGNEIAVAVVNNLGGDSIENYANSLFREWGIGSKETNKGVLLLVSIEDRKMRIEVGYGLEGILTDLGTYRIQTDIISPYFKEQQYFEGIQAGVNTIVNTLAGEEIPAPKQKKNFLLNGDMFQILFVFLIFGAQILFGILAPTKSWWLGGLLGGGVGLGIGFFMGSLVVGGISVIGLVALGLLVDFLVSRSYTKHGNSRNDFWTGPWMGGGFGGGSGGGGFGGFGGGSSGGGGSSSSW